MRARIAAALALAAAWPLVEPQLPVLRRAAVHLLPPGSPPLRVLHLSDLHLLPRHRRLAAWVSRLAEADPDLVVSTGDHLSGVGAVPLLTRALGALTTDGTPGVFVPGNNDYFSPRPPSLLGYLRAEPNRRRIPDLPWGQVAAALRDVGWTELTHRRQELQLGGTTLVLAGTDDGHLGRDRYAAVAGPIGAGGLGIGVTHTPRRRLLDAFDRDGFRLVLAGHTHGGQLRLPGAGALVTNCDLERSRARGLSRSGRGWLHVSAGLGTSPYLPIRLCCRPEATLLHLLPGPPPA